MDFYDIGIYFAVPYILHDTSIPNPDAMLPMCRWEGAGITLLVGTIPLIVANLLAFIFVWKEKIKLPARLLLFLPGIICIWSQKINLLAPVLNNSPPTPVFTMILGAGGHFLRY